MKIAAVSASGWIMLLAGCALAGNPQPPSLWLPRPVRDLAAQRMGTSVHLRWTMPRHTTDNLELRGPQRARFCWMPAQSSKAVFNAQQCKDAGGSAFMPHQSADYSVPLPVSLTQGAPGAVAFFVELENPAGKTAGPSNPAWIAIGSAPAAVTGLILQTSPEGVVLHWAPSAPAAGTIMRIDRTLVPPPKAPKPSETSGAPPPQEQVLEVSLSQSDPGGAVDRDATLDRTYRYTVQRVHLVQVRGRTLELAGAPSETVTLDAKDIFPPSVPAGLVAISDDQAHAIDLSWSPDTAPDLAGYFVCRRDLTANTGWQRISGESPLVPPSWEDRDVVAGHRYAYAISAVDEDGNESARSAEVIEELPQ